MSQTAEFIEELKIVETILLFTAFAVCFSLAKSFLGVNVHILHAMIPAGIFFIANAAHYIYEEFM